MANQYKNKVVYNGTTLIDLSDTTAVQSDVASGKYFYLATGEKVEGTASGGDEPVTPTETLLGQTPYTLTEDATIRLKSTSETTYSTGSGVVKDFDDRENQTLTSATLTDQGTYWELADNGGAAWYASKMTFTISGLTANNTYTARIGAAGDGTTSISGYWLIYDQSSSTIDDTPLVSQALETTDGALQFTPTESTILVRVLPSQSYYWDQGIKTSRFSYFRIEGEVSGTFTGSVDLGQLSSGTTITSTPSCDVYAVIESSGSLSGKTCVCLGDSVTGLMAPPNDYPSVLASNTGMTVINGGFEGCRMSDTHPSTTYAAFSAVKLADAIATETWTTQDANISGFESGSYAPSHLTALKAVDWSNVDYITVEFGGNDAGDQYVYIDNAQNPTDTTTYVGAARYVYNRIHTAYPNIKIMFFVPMYRYWISEGKDSDEMTFTLGGNTYHYYDWGDALIASPPASGVPVIDMYRTLGINATNRQTYLLASDQTHPSVAGCELIAQKFETELTNHFLPSGGSSATLITKTITANGTYNASDDSADGYSSVTVNVPASAVDSGTKSITANGSNQDVVGYAAVNVNVPNTYTAADEGKVVSSGALVAQTAHAEVTQNGTIDTTLNNSVTVNVSGGASYDGIEIKTSGTTVTEYACHMSTIPDFALNYIDFTKGVNDGLSQITFPVKPTHVGKRAFFQAKARIDWSGLSDMETADEYALASAYISQADWTGDEVTLPSFVGYTSSHNAQNLFRFDGSTAQTYCPKKYSLPVCVVIPQFMLYGIRASNIDVTIGSVGHAVTESKRQPFGSSSNASGAVVIYTTGTYLDSVKTAVQNGLGSNITLTFKASEATTYGGSSYAAGATILIV